MLVFGLKKPQFWAMKTLLVLCFLMRPHYAYPNSNQDGENSTQTEESPGDAEGHELVDDDDDGAWEDEQDLEEEMDADYYPPNHPGPRCVRKTGQCKVDENCCEPLICRRHIFHKRCK